MAVPGGGGDQKQKLAAGREAGRPGAADGGSFEVEAYYWPSPLSSPSSSSTRQMLDGGNHQQEQEHGGIVKRRGRRKKMEINWGSLWDKAKDWIRSPLNMALLVWIAAVGVSGAILFMVMTGMLNRVLPRKPQRDTWFEVNNQILNALFTLMCLYQHPRRFHHLVLLWRWRIGDMLQLRQHYCKGGACKPGERRHMAVVITLLHLNCFAQYALCALNWGYARPRRPPVGVGLTLSVAICAAAAAGLYNNLSPLGRDYDAAPQPDEESQSQQSNPQLQRKTPRLPLEIDERSCYSFAPTQQGSGGGHHEWVGELFDLCWDGDLSLAYLSVFCSCCLFGWNMSRLGLGNMYVHIVTFLLFCLAPYFIFNLAAVNIDNEAVRVALGLGGVLLCVLGLLYGGFWRIQMRRRFGLPENHACCGKPDLTDYLHWLCCYSCSLAQEVRTADAYDLVSQPDTTSNSQMHLHHHPTLEEELSTMRQPLRFAQGVFAPSPPAATSVINHGATTVPPSVSVIHKH